MLYIYYILLKLKNYLLNIIWNQLLNQKLQMKRKVPVELSTGGKSVLALND